MTVFTHDFAPKPSKPSVMVSVAGGVFVLLCVFGGALGLLFLPGAR